MSAVAPDGLPPAPCGNRKHAAPWRRRCPRDKRRPGGRGSCKPLVTAPGDRRGTPWRCLGTTCALESTLRGPEGLETANRRAGQGRAGVPRHCSGFWGVPTRGAARGGGRHPGGDPRRVLSAGTLPHPTDRASRSATCPHWSPSRRRRARTGRLPPAGSASAHLQPRRRRGAAWWTCRRTRRTLPHRVLINYPRQIKPGREGRTPGMETTAKRRGGRRPGAGRPKGSRNKATLAREVAGRTLTELAREATTAAVDTLRDVMTDPAVPGSARVAAATALLDRAYGRPAQRVEAPPSRGDDDKPDKPDFNRLTVDELRTLCALVDKSQGGSGSSYWRAVVPFSKSAGPPV